jgi:hypothetical protein
VFDLVFALFANKWYQSLVRDSIEKKFRVSFPICAAAAVFFPSHRRQLLAPLPFLFLPPHAGTPPFSAAARTRQIREV